MMGYFLEKNERWFEMVQNGALDCIKGFLFKKFFRVKGFRRENLTLQVFQIFQKLTQTESKLILVKICTFY